MKTDYLVAAILAAGSIVGFTFQSQAQALDCTVDATPINLSTIETLGGSNQPIRGKVTVSCSDPSQPPIACVRVTNKTPLLNGTYEIEFALAENEGGTQLYTTTYSAPVSLQNDGSKWTGEFPLYAILTEDNSESPVGSYMATANLSVGISDQGATDCNGPLSEEQPAPIVVSGNVVADCDINASDIDFGTVGLLNSAVTRTGTVEGSCTPGTSYSIELNDGLHPLSFGGTRQMISTNGDFLQYDLYKDNAHSQRWGAGSDGVESEVSAGGANTYSHTIYAQLPPQITAVGKYADTVTATIIYSEAGN